MSVEQDQPLGSERSPSDVRRMFVAGQRRYPLLKVGFDCFARACQRVLEQEGGLPLEAADFYLCCGCVEGEPEALRTIEREGLPAARAAIRRIDPDDDFVHDTLQELWSRLLVGDDARVRAFSGRGPLQAWVRVAAARLALDRRRVKKRGAEREVALSETLAAADVSPEAELLRARFGPAFREALRTALAELSKQERNVLRMHVVGRCSIDEIGRAYAVHRATAARWIERARTGIYERVRELLSLVKPLTDSEFRSLAGILGAELHLSLTLASSNPAAEPSATDES